MKLREIYQNTDIRERISFEVFPPKDPEKHQCLVTSLTKAKTLNPAFVSLTWGATGSTNNSLELVKTIKQNGLNIMPHFTCVCSTKEYVANHLKILTEYGIENILALRGDIPEDKSLLHNDFKYANELVEFIKNKSNLSVGVAGYPEGHIESENLQTDIKNLKKKIDAGADAVFTQLFFDNTKFYEYIDKVRKIGINTPIIAGIMPIISQKQIDKMTSLARITIPKEVEEKLNTLSAEDLKIFGIEYASKQCEELIKSNVDGLHFFTLNKIDLTAKIINNII